MRLRDNFGRTFRYLRLSVTDACNFSCAYCLPEGFKSRSAETPLSVSEISNLVGAFSQLGISKVRLTGGEPTVRQDILDIVRVVAQTPGVTAVGLTTNGYRLAELAQPLREAGVTSLNLSLDSLDRERFRRITGRDRLNDVLSGLEAALRAGFETVKLNVVLLRDLDEAELNRFFELTRGFDISVRFIELMRTGSNEAFFASNHLSGEVLRQRLLGAGWSVGERSSESGPAVEFRHPEYRGALGLIAPYSKDFCASCNRLRITSQGKLRLCLFGEADYSLRDKLADASQRPALEEEVLSVLSHKVQSHFLHEGRFGNTSNLAQIGG